VTGEDIRPSASRLRETLLGAALLFVLLNLTLLPFVWGDRTLQDSTVVTSSLYDAGTRWPRAQALVALPILDPCAAACQTEPWFAFEHDMLASEHAIPLWEPYAAFGKPLAANMQSQPYSPFAWVAIVSHGARGYDWYVMLRIYVAGLFAFLFLRMWLRFVPALAGALSFMYAGYLWLFLTHPQLSVDVLLPALLYAVELVVRRPRGRTGVLLAVFVALSVLGGMPESTFVDVLFAYAYAAYRVLSVRDGAERVRALHLAGAGVLGFALSAIQALPFAEYAGLSHNQHIAFAQGTYHDAFAPSMLAQYLAPLLHGPPVQGIFGGQSGLRGFFGAAAAFFALVGAFGWIADTVRARLTGVDPTPFFFAALLIAVAKRFGAGLVNWIGGLPLFSAVQFAKHEESVVALSVAVLAAYGIARLCERRVSFATACAALLAALLVVTAGPASEARTLGALTEHQLYFAASLVWALVALGVAFALALAVLAGRVSAARAAAVAAVLIVVDLHAAFFVPMYYVVNAGQEPPQSASALSGAPYVRFLQEHLGHDRFYGQDALLQPEWGTAFEVADVRGLDALYPARYLAFVEAFYPPEIRDRLRTRFDGGPLQFAAPLERRFLTLSSVRYVGTYVSALDDKRPSLLAAALAGHPELQSPYLRPGLFGIAGASRYGVFMAPTHSLPARVRVPRDAGALAFSIGMLEESWAGHPLCADGVEFSIQVRGGGRVRDLFRKYIDPKHDPAQRHWFDQSVSLQPYRGKTVDLVFSTAPGPSKDGCWDWSVWGDARIRAARAPRDDAPAGAFRMAFEEPGAQIYEFHDPLPRVAVYRRARAVSSPDAALGALVDPAFDPAAETVVETDPAALARLPAARAPVAAGTFEAYSTEYVRAAVDVPAPGDAVVVLNDTLYPGWKALVDGRETPMVAANYLFRGVVVPPGKHTIEYRFESGTYRAGTIVTLAALVAALLWLAADVLGASLRARRAGRVEP
jgi:hypothetical protein